MTPVGRLVHTNGFGRSTPRRICFSLNAANQRSTRLIHDLPVGVKLEARMLRQPAVNQRRLVRAGVVDDEVDVQRRGDGAAIVSRNLRNSRAR